MLIRDGYIASTQTLPYVARARPHEKRDPKETVIWHVVQQIPARGKEARMSVCMNEKTRLSLVEFLRPVCRLLPLDPAMTM